MAISQVKDLPYTVWQNTAPPPIPSALRCVLPKGFALNFYAAVLHTTAHCKPFTFLVLLTYHVKPYPNDYIAVNFKVLLFYLLIAFN